MTGLWLTRRRPAAGRPRRQARLGALLTVVVGVLVMLAAGTGLAVVLSSAPRPVDAGTLPPTTTVYRERSRPPDDAAAAAGQSGAGGSGLQVLPPGPPQRLQLPALGIDAPISPVGVAGDGTLGVPDDVHALGWWDRSAPAGAPAGTTVVDGHVDSAAAGPGALFRLSATPLGAQLTLTTGTGTGTGGGGGSGSGSGSGSGTVRYTVVARRAYPKSGLPTGLFTTSGPRRLVVITCGGSFDATRRHYTDNIVIYAIPT